MSYSNAVRETWRHCDLGEAARHPAALVHYARLAASSHNTQPWKFRLEPRRVTILPDFSRRCPQVDPDDHHLFASLGCAAENLAWAAQAAGLHAHFAFDAPQLQLVINLEAAPAVRSPLFDAILVRQCSRTEYDGAALPSAQLRSLEQAARGEGVDVLLITDQNQKERIAEYVAQGAIAQLTDPQWTRELNAWIRFSAREALRSRDGLYGPVMGFPNVPRWVGKLAMRLGGSVAQQNAKDLLKIRSSFALAVLHSEANEPRGWVQAGRSYERLALQAAAHDLRTAFINQPVEVAALRSQLATYLGIGHRRPDFIVRIGRGPHAARSLRRSVEHVLAP